MLTVAVAGGTGHLGLTIVEVLQENPKYRVVVLSRKLPNNQRTITVPTLEVDYADVDATTRLLERHDVHTIVSALSLKTADGSAAELQLVAAAAKSSTTKRFMASDWSIPIPSDPTLRLPQDAFRIATLSALRTTGENLEWTSLHVGQIADYLGTPHLVPSSHMGVYALHVDVAHAAASIPGTGDDLVSFSYSRDVARFVEAVVGMKRWEREEMSCYSDVCSLNEVVRLAEEVRGMKFTVAYDAVEMLERGEMTELPAHRNAYAAGVGKEPLQKRIATFGLYGVKGMLHLPEEGSLNSMFPEIKTMKIADILSFWKGK